jgi:adrenodoxin-NADP+ reductase
VQNKFTSVAQDPRVSFLGNVNVGKSITIDDLKLRYNYLVLAYGAGKNKMLNIPGEDSYGVVSAKDFVGWYNGVPNFSKKFQPNLNHERVAIIGVGNVALDIARVLLSDIDVLRKTDMPGSVLEILSSSKVKHVDIFARRGPLEVSFSSKELREMLISGLSFETDTKIIKYEMEKVLSKKQLLDRPTLRLMKLLESLPIIPFANKSWKLHFFLNPKKFTTNENRLTGIEFCKTFLDNNDRLCETGELFNIDTQLVFKSIGYESVPLGNIPFDQVKMIVPNVEGRVLNDPGLVIKYISKI